MDPADPTIGGRGMAVEVRSACFGVPMGPMDAKVIVWRMSRVAWSAVAIRPRPTTAGAAMRKAAEPTA